MGINPCCMPLQKGVQIMAIIDVVLDTLNVISVAVAISDFVNKKEDNEKHYTHDKITSMNKELDAGIVTLSITMLMSVMALLLSVRLYFGAKRKDLPPIKKWLIITTIVLTITIIVNIVNSVVGEIHTVNIVSSAISVLYRIYMMWVVFTFYQELKKEGAYENPNNTT